MDTKASSFQVVTYHFQLLYHMAIAEFLDRARELLNKSSEYGLFMMSCDFTMDLDIGFEPEVLMKTLNNKYKHNTERQGQFSMKAMIEGSEDPWDNFTIS